MSNKKYTSKYFTDINGNPIKHKKVSLLKIIFQKIDDIRLSLYVFTYKELLKKQVKDGKSRYIIPKDIHHKKE